MTGEPSTRHIVVMGVSGAGKTTVARGIAARTGLAFAEADEFHSEANVARMRAGIPLDDDDRWPWLQALADWMTARHREGVSTVLTCSALKRSYRDLLRQGPPGVFFVHLDGPTEVIRERMSVRTHEYMPPSLLNSQTATLEPLWPDEPGIVIDLRSTSEALVDEAVRRLGLPARDESPEALAGIEVPVDTELVAATEAVAVVEERPDLSGRA
ncbi:MULTISPECIES: gluconokinase [Micromonospora]|uniref:gluconokinase n=1 Tax=Micromonospora TaxID=1873 RepID=UPI000206B7D1|nr:MULTISPECIES: gluconokinase [Micromonospora]AEB45335.1 gluconate kinase [Micromonospora maris AB-18-032]RUL95236.1 gluconokinase [Verrucosispora sp. FIM060022]